MDSDDLKKLEDRVADLLEAYHRLKQETRTLQTSHQALAAEHAKLMERTQTARERIESMIGRLKALERSEG